MEHKYTSFLRNHQQHTKMLYNVKTGHIQPPVQMVYMPEVDEQGNFVNPSVGEYFKSALWMAGSLLLFAWALLRIGKAFTGM